MREKTKDISASKHICFGLARTITQLAFLVGMADRGYKHVSSHIHPKDRYGVIRWVMGRVWGKNLTHHR